MLREVPTTRVPNRQLQLCLERSSEIFTHKDSCHQIHLYNCKQHFKGRVLKLASLHKPKFASLRQSRVASSPASWRAQGFISSKSRPSSIQDCVPFSKLKSAPLQIAKACVFPSIQGCVSSQLRVVSPLQFRVASH